MFSDHLHINPKSSDWSNSLISWSLEELEGSMSIVRNLPRTMRPKLVVIEASRVLFDCIFVSRVLRVITHEIRSRDVSALDLTNSDGFYRSLTVRDSRKSSDIVSETENESPYVKID